MLELGIAEIIGILGFVAGIIGVAVAYRSLRESIPRVVYSHAVVYPGSHPKVDILYDDHIVIADLHSLKLAFWNAGRRELRSDDIPEVHGPRIVFPENTGILDVKCEALSESTQASLDFDSSAIYGPTPGGNELPIAFEFLNRNQGFYAEILYTSGTDIEEPPIRLVGSFKGAKPIKEFNWPREQSRRDALGLVIFPGVALALMVIWEIESWFPRVFAPLFLFAFIYNFREYSRMRVPAWVQAKFPAHKRGVLVTADYVEGRS